jgi:hypothetical protein
MHKIILAVVWLVGWVHVLGFAPEGGESVTNTIATIMTPKTEVFDPLVFMVFNLLGIWPLIMVAVLVQDTQGRLKAWPFAFSSMVLGNSALYIYLFLRKEQQPFEGPKSRLVRFSESKILALVLLGTTISLLVYGLSKGSFAAFIETWQVNVFVNVMTVDFFLFPIAFAFVLADDMRRRDMPINAWFWFYALLPALGAVIYLTVRARLPDATPQNRAVSAEVATS